MEVVEAKPLNHYQRYVKPRLLTDPEFKARHHAQMQKAYVRRCKTIESVRLNRNEHSRVSKKNRYDNDPEFREKQKAYARQYYHNKKHHSITEQTADV